MMKKYLLLLLLAFNVSVFAQSPTCGAQTQFCGDVTLPPFPNSTNAGSASLNEAAGYGCLFTYPNPAWFYTQVDESGSITFTISQEDAAGNGIDVDFIAWGPFTGPPPICGPSNLNAGTQVGCSYSPIAVETFTIPSAVSGQYYVLLLTNFSNRPGLITFEQTGGTGTLNCFGCEFEEIDDFTLCNGEIHPVTAVLTSTISTYDPAQTTYQWSRSATLAGAPGTNIPGAVTPTLNISSPGVYTITANNTYCGSSGVSETFVVTAQAPFPTSNPQNLTFCTPNLQPPYSYNLRDNDPVILNTQDPTRYLTSFYNSSAEANAGTPAIAAPTAYISPGGGEQIFVRIDDAITGCHIVRSFTLSADWSPVANFAADIQVCDNPANDVANGGPGIEIFDITSRYYDILGDQDETQVFLSFHSSMANLVAGVSIPRQTSVSSSGQTIYARVSNANNLTCYDVVTFRLIVTPYPIIVPPAPGYGCTNDPYLLPAISVGGYYTLPGGAGRRMPVGEAISTDSTIYIYAESGTTPNNCTDEDSFTVTIIPEPVAQVLAPVVACSSYELLPLDPGNRYFTAPGGPTGGGTELFAGSIITTPGLNVLYVYNESGSAATRICTDEVSFNVTIEIPPTISAPTAMETCDDFNADGLEEFDLTIAGAQVVGGQSNLVVTYHNIYAEAEIGANAIQRPATYRTGTTTIYIRVVEQGALSNCPSIETLQLTVHPNPIPGLLADYTVCDVNNSPDGIEEADLHVWDSQVTSDPANTVVYYLSNTDAQLDQNRIADPTHFRNTIPWEQRIWVRVTSPFSCVGVGSFLFKVTPLPVTNPALQPFYVCEEVSSPGIGIFDLPGMDTEITLGAAGYTVTYYATLADAENPTTTTELPDSYVTASTTIYARVENYRTLCYTVTPVQLEVQPLPVIASLAIVNSCDPNNDDVTVFNLQPTLDAISAANSNVTVTVYETHEDAYYFGGRNPIPDPSNYTNLTRYTVNGSQTLYVRVENNLTGCYNVAELTIVVNPVPEATDPLQDYVICDNGAVDTDGLGVFDLTSYSATVLNTMNPAQFLLSYFHSYDDAADDSNAITNPAAYLSSSSSEIVYIKVTNSVTGCYDIVDLQLTVNPLPVANQPTPISLCDDDNDQNQVFDLTTKIPEITGGADGVDVTFHDTFVDADGGTNAYTEAQTLNYTNSSPGVETIFVRVTNRDTGCYRVVLLDVRVEALPTLTLPTADDLALCDTDGDGYTIIDLTALVADMVNHGGASVTVNFYETEEDALDGVRPILNPAQYMNLNPFSHNVWVVAENAAGCSSIPVMLTFTISPAPQVPDLDPLEKCDDDDDDQDNRVEFDLTEQDAIIRVAPGITSSTLIYYYASEADARNGGPRIIRPARYVGTGGTFIWVRTEDPLTECFSVTSFELIVNKPVDVTEPTQLVKCDPVLSNPFPQAEFDLTVKDEEILAPTGLGQLNVVTYYESDADVAANNPITNPETYTNPPGENPKTLSVVVTTPEGCISQTYLTIRVLPQPTPNPAPDPLELCDETNPGDLVEEFDLTLAARNILRNAANTVLTYYVELADAELGIPGTEIPDPTQYESASAIIYVRASLAGSETGDASCAQVVPLELIVNPMPMTSVETYAICQQPYTGTATFDLGNYRNEILGPGAVQTDYIVRFYADDPNVVAPGINNPTLPFLYNTATTTIYVSAENIATECKIVLPLLLSVEPQTIANAVDASEFIECDYDGTNDGFFEFDLTLANDDIVGAQGPLANYDVTFYLTETDALAGVNPIPNPTAYTNVTANSQTIWAEVRNNQYDYGCPAYVSFNLVVTQLPEPTGINGDDLHTSCVDFIDNTLVYNSVRLDSGIPAGAGHTYQWFVDGVAIPGAVASTYDAVETGTYTVVATGPTGCISEPSAGYDVVKSGPASLIGDGYVVSNAFSQNQSITVLVEGFGNYQYSMYPNGPWQNSNVFTNVATGYHTIYIRDITEENEDLRCDVVTIENVSTIDYPKFFTPNNDGYNDYWNIIGLANFPSSQIFIFDRYGKLIKQLSPKSNPAEGQGWDGTFNGVPLPSDDYWFTVTFPEGNTVREFKAHFALKR
ncbi:T9SS type B sorting domain-containing protein [Flavobacterium sp. Sd200]|uniref:T9SS type B sorting domain-containing protein n=1 Tax=Flavobacterium sp. Sd200 TaxID=2692211 RepID=UPI0013704A69|nr:T9SS type B sorting domain-containing protein [Flavobacterium sp. Sd200]MXN92349.1 T9SS type B sorting domain-containing protein [Flavobacterium sp. Sd200]